MVMINHWKELVPVDQYRVMTKGILNDYDRKIISMLYQPLIGPLSTSLYFTLWSELESNQLLSQESNHYQLMNVLNLPLNDIYEARKKLEGIGLLKVYKRAGEEHAQFMYELMAPLSPAQFFTDGMLNIYLYKKVGRAHFLKLKRFFSDDIVIQEGFVECTKSFVEVFASTHSDSLYVSDNGQVDLKLETGQVYVDHLEAKELNGFMEQFDFDLFYSGVGSYIPEKAFTKEIQRTIAKLAYVYSIDALPMQNVVRDAYDIATEEITIEALRKAAQNWYHIEYNDKLPSLSNRIQPLDARSDTSDVSPQEEEKIRHLEETSPRELLRQYGKGAEPTLTEMKIIEEVMLDQDLAPGIMNVLIEFVLLKNDMRFPGSYVKTIASHWKKKDLKTVKEAMDFARSQMEKEKQREAKKATSYRKSSKPTRKEIVPEWLKEQKQQQQNEDVEKKNIEETDEEFLAEREKLLKELRSKY